MLTLTRDIHQAVLIGESAKMVVDQLLPRLVHMTITTAAGETKCTLRVGSRHTIAAHNGVPVHIHLRSVHRGVARFGFEAPKEISIQREERFRAQGE